jgi:hypothetical protein
MCELSMEKLAPSLLAADGRWGRMEKGRWDAYLDWLAGAGLLTTYVNSRAGGEGKATLDELRRGQSGETIKREDIDAAMLFFSVW